MNSGCRSQTTCQRRDSINLFCLVADRFGGKTYRQRAEVKFNFFKGTGIAKSLSYYSFRVVFAVQRLCVFKVAAIGFSSTAGPKQTEALLCADTNKNGTLHSHTRDKNWVNECQCRQFLTKLQKNYLQEVKRATSRLQVRLTHLWLVPDPSTSPSGF